MEMLVFLLYLFLPNTCIPSTHLFWYNLRKPNIERKQRLPQIEILAMLLFKVLDIVFRMPRHHDDF